VDYSCGRRGDLEKMGSLVNRVIELRRPEPVTLRANTIEIDREAFVSILNLLAQLIEAQPLAASEQGLLLQTVSRLSWCLFELICREDSHGDRK
jgi:hypothetical protein